MSSRNFFYNLCDRPKEIELALDEALNHIIAQEGPHHELERNGEMFIDTGHRREFLNRIRDGLGEEEAKAFLRHVKSPHFIR